MPVELTQVEFQIMEYFFTNPGKALRHRDILTRVWGSISGRKRSWMSTSGVCG